ncbi:kinase-like protein [Delitschia confertaspora ATCC 74209]|uniref:cyclin-dependent kinase n=1 Tax=Delitschia confertaspora ATCC 74209 TaxID=1513339 RepID=A0A9P4MXC7_9PLEO|nr:kinase-like protein [Delitschia confertaspora ATCC 74209]
MSPTEARSAATALEAKLYDEAESTEDYGRRCENSIANISRENVSHVREDDMEESEPGTGTPLDIGSYKHATYYREGLFSVIYRAPALDHLTYFAPDAPKKSRIVALKLTTPAMMEPPHNSDCEARILKMAKSPHVIPLLETFREAGTRFVLVFPFVPYDLAQLLKQQLLSEHQTIKCLRDLFKALEFIHRHGIIHRDVKPSNILLKSLDGPAYLSDFGISWAANVPGIEPADSKITDVGTTCYRAPELLFGNKKYGCSLDLWAAGCTVAEAVVPGHPTLFEAGDLGSELALIQSIFKKLGTPDLTVWPEAANLPDWGKMEFWKYPPKSWSELLPGAPAMACHFVSQLVRFESATRMDAATVRGNYCPGPVNRLII